METKIPIFDAIVNEDLTGIELKQMGIQNIALVDSPAMLTEWLMFSNQTTEMKFALNEEQQIITAPVIIADLLIKRIVEGKEFFVKYTKQTNMKILQKYMIDGNQKKIKLTHDTNDMTKGVYVFEWFMSDESRGIQQPKGFDLPDGTIFCSMKINNPDVWKRVKSGEVKGISLEGFFDLHEETQLTQNEIDAIINMVI